VLRVARGGSGAKACRAPQELEFTDTQIHSQVYVTVQMEVADDVSGFKMAELILTSVSHSSSFLTYVVDTSTIMNPPAAAYGGWTTQLWQGSFWFQSGDEAGPWTLTRLRLRDHAANYREYATNDLFLLGAQQNATVDVGSRIRIACTSDAWIKCASSGGRCQAPTPSNPPESSSVCVCSNMPNRASNQLVCLSDTVLDFSNASFWDGSGKLDGSGISPRNVGVTWSGVLDDAVAPDTTSVASQQQATSVEDRETPWQPPPDTSETGRDVWASTVTARSIISILMPCMGVMLCVHACRRIRYLRSLRRINRGEASMSSLPDVRSPSAQPGWMRGLLWRHARQVDRRRELVSQRDADLAAQGLRAQVDTSGRIISLLALHPEQAAHNSLESWRMRGGEAAYQMPLPQNGRLGQVPTAPARVAMPAHLLPGAVNNQGGDKMELEDIAEGEECCVCFAARQSARLNPCGHQDLCVGCAEFMLHNSPYCPMCRSPITSVT